ncbi:Endonuclease/exonuclease/phosphatase [Cinara cedri]|uniref:Endonuclease/exonuclease/phosphatase n=1 Tax=Cinara cedri TaxID=506608 RepID=A0A5E4M835_9HEMI|nr:Endonuclease/exonuclease/phosphatase [Cinara cedri]
MVKLRSYPNETILLQVYMPTSNDDIGEVEKVYEDIEELLKLTKQKDILIKMGDFNAVIGGGLNGKEVGNYGLGKRNDRGDRLLEFCRQHELVIFNTLFNNHKRRRYTWKMPGDLGRYQIDFILVRNRFKNQVKSCKTYPGADINSDHNLVMMKYNEGRSKKEIKSRIGQAKKAFLLKSKLLTSKNVHQRTRKRLIKTYVLSTALYGCETWTLNKKEETALEAFEMWCWRKMEKIKWTELKTNEEVLDLVREKNIAK